VLSSERCNLQASNFDARITLQPKIAESAVHKSRSNFVEPDLRHSLSKGPYGKPIILNQIRFFAAWRGRAALLHHNLSSGPHQHSCSSSPSVKPLACPSCRAFAIEEIEMGKHLLTVSGLALAAGLGFSGVADANVLTGKGGTSATRSRATQSRPMCRQRRLTTPLPSKGIP
jgi:hypothetical protein